MADNKMTVQDPPAIAQGYEVVRIKLKLRKEPERFLVMNC